MSSSRLPSRPILQQVWLNRPKTGRFVDILEGVEAQRIRRCSECTRIFWAGRVDKSACDDKCVNRRNVRLHRERYPEYKYQRYRKAEAASSMRPPLRERP